ncbi:MULTISPECIES: restriction endonuclease subunit R [unclassified Campylobacter]|uniref:restriction endonuclease subunit R n=1 Tax=unclassified Campylobacter TaxID=2593542 RepID=UPI0022E9F59D|nr:MULTISPECIES: restriction endonuclease subunit R [unclassified Campylobacter]MDA3062407.1 restriction endonuclease subunit R [Campylobacter sp. JMF_14 EL1]MDA3073474.1 restriction endonuclease subunit R [Campylobacter sp. JMF_10 EL2]
MTKILQDILNLDPSKECLKFLVKRLQVDDYRGIVISQHNRYTIKEILVILEELYSVANTDLLQIRTTDLSKRPNNIIGEEKYANLTNNISNKLCRCTQDSLRKNIFVDMHRMGLINRFNAKKEILEPFASGTKKYVQISEFGLELLRAKDIFTQNLLFTRALESLFNGLGEDILDICLELQKNYISEFEMLFFANFIYQKLDNVFYSKENIIEFIREFRAMSKFTKEKLIELVKEYCIPNSFAGTKKDKRDFHNWINETQQIFSLLNQMVYFEWDREENRLYIRVGSDAIYDDSSKLKRSLQEKQNYFKEHKVSKTNGFELHHIVPLCFARNKQEYKVIDNWKNLVYIDAYSHAKITHNKNRNIKLNFEGTTAVFSDFKDIPVKCEKDKEILYSIEKQTTMLDYNEKLLNAVE